MRDTSFGWWNDIARALFGFMEHDPLLLEDAIRAAVVLQTDRPEWGFVGQELLCGQEVALVTPGVGNFGAAVLRNPIGSNVLAVVTHFEVTHNLAGTLRARVFPRRAQPIPGTFTGMQPGSVRDTRWEDTKQRQGTCDAGGLIHTVELGFAIGTIADNGLNDSGTERQWPVALGPGSLLLVWASATNIQIRGSFTWRERMLQSAGLRS